jgi:hypothetical protein
MIRLDLFEGSLNENAYQYQEREQNFLVSTPYTKAAEQNEHDDIKNGTKK